MLKKVTKKLLSTFKYNTSKIIFKKNAESTGYKNIIYILHGDQNIKSGGDKVAYKHSEIINRLGVINLRSAVLHAENIDVELKWFDHNVAFKKNLNFNSQNDFVVIPEILAVPYAKMLSDIGVKYAIFVQGGYIITTPLFTCGYDDLALAYQNSSLILAISSDAKDCIAAAFPNLVDKVISVSYSVDSSMFKAAKSKERIITYMPRRLKRHADLIQFFLNQRLPSDWKFQPIDGLDEHGVSLLLGRSSIFISLSELEGCPLPPIEAALSGNHVIGYTGEGAKEYFKKPIFTEVNCGDIKNFANLILDKITELEATNMSKNYVSAVDELSNQYSKNTEVFNLIKFVDKVDEILS